LYFLKLIAENGLLIAEINKTAAATVTKVDSSQTIRSTLPYSTKQEKTNSFF
jgi:hypothetical protein